jgi:Pectinacetylesterase
MKPTHRSVVVVLVLGFASALAHCTTASTGDPGIGDPSLSTSGSNGGATSGGGSGASLSSGSTNEGDDGSPGSSSGASSSGSTSSGGSTSTSSGGGSTGDDGGAACAANESTQKSFVNLAVPMLSALPSSENDAIPTDAGTPLAVPQGWNYYAISGALCRDGSPAGIYVHHGTVNKLFIYLEGGGACSSPTFCSHNPAAVSQAFPGGAPSQGQTIGGSLGSVTGGPYQAPYVPTAASGLTAAYSPGIFDFTNAANPVKDWSGVYVPYCTGDVHFGTADNVTIPGDDVLPAVTGQHFVGYRNMQKFIGHLVPTFPNLTQVLLTGASAGGFGAGLNYGMVQDSFGTIPVTVLDDSGPPFTTADLPACIQKQWRDLWGFDAALPSDCAECTNPDGSGLTDIVKYWHHKYPHARVGLVSTVQDEVMRLFFGSSNNNCATNNATALAVSGGLTGAQYTMGLQDLLTTYQCTGALATYYIGGMNSNFPYPSYHQHIFRSEFYTVDTNSGSQTMAQWTADLLNGTLDIDGP